MKIGKTGTWEGRVNLPLSTKIQQLRIQAKLLRIAKKENFLDSVGIIKSEISTLKRQIRILLTTNNNRSFQ